MHQTKLIDREVASRLAFYVTLLVAGVALAYFAVEKPATRYLAIDTIQHLSVARNLTNGFGLTTSILYYSIHYTFGTVPVPQTVWPPGAAINAAAAGLFGIELADAFVLFSIASVLAASATLYVAMRRSGIRMSVASPAAAMWAASPSTWHFAIRGETEAPFVLFCWLSIYFVIRATSSKARDLVWVGAGICAALAVAWRYQGVYLGPALLVAGLLATHGHPLRKRLIALTWLLGPMALVFSAVVLRNLALSGAITGVHGAVIDPLSLSGAIKYAAWFTERSLADFIGVRPSLATRMTLVLCIATAAWVIVMVFRAARPPSRAELSTVEFHRVQAVATMAVASFAVFALTHMLLGAVTTATWYLAGVRYITVLLPSLIFLVALGAELAHRLKAPVETAERLPPVVSIAASALWLVVIWTLAASFAATSNLRATTADIETALATRTANGSTVGEYLQANNARLRPMLASWAHELHLVDAKPVVGLQPTSTSLKNWDFAAMLALCDSIGLRSVLVVDSHLAPPRDNYTANQTALQELAAGKQHPRLQLLLDARGVKLFEVLPQRP